MGDKKTICILIPARMNSTRFHGKPLASIAGTSMIERVYRSCEKTKSSKINFTSYVVTDSHEIDDHVLSFGGRSVIVEDECFSGTERIFKGYQKISHKLSADLIFNVQGDEPLVRGSDLLKLAVFHLDHKFDMMTLVKRKRGDEDTFKDPSTVKVIWVEKTKRCHYFSRSPIPYGRLGKERDWFLHIGIYSYSIGSLKQICDHNISPYERGESLEQLRAVENGFKIGGLETQNHYISVDHPEDVMRVEELLDE